MSVIFTYYSRNENQGGSSLFKGATEKVVFSIDLTNAIPSGITISTTTATALNAGNGTVTSFCIGTTAYSGNVVTVSTLSCGTAGTATDGERFKLTTTATLSNGEILTYPVFILIQAPTYAPD